MASYGGEQNVNRLISANASFTRQRDDARRSKQLAEERLNLVKKDSEFISRSVRCALASTVIFLCTTMTAYLSPEITSNPRIIS